MAADSDILSELDWMPNYTELVRAFADILRRAAQAPMTSSRRDHSREFG
jgi:hypothetical protein